MGQAKFYLINGYEETELQSYTADESQLEAVKFLYNSRDIETYGLLIVTTLAPPVFNESSSASQLNLGQYGDQIARKIDWLRNGEPYILCV